MSDLNEKVADFHVRLGRLEEMVSRSIQRPPDTAAERAVEALTILFAVIAAYLGFGLPNHYYQVIFAALIVAALYHRGTFPRLTHTYQYAVAGLNVCAISMLLKIVIGGGEPRPFHWIYVPNLEGGLTSFNLTWQATAVGEWILPLTLIQTFFLILTLFGVLIGFELFSALTSFLLILLALPSLVSFNWEWGMPGMIAALFSLYLQADEA